MIKELYRTLTGTYIQSNTTIIFDSNPYLNPTNELVILMPSNDTKYSTTVSSVSGNNAVVTFNDPQYANTRVTVRTPCFGTTGVQDAFTLSYTNPPNILFQAVSDGGTNAVDLQVSTDKLHWITANTMNVTVASGNTAYTTITSPWPYGRLNITAVGANNTVRVNKVA